MIKSKTHVEGVSIHLVTATKEKVHQPLTEGPAFHQRRSRLITGATRISHAIMQRSWRRSWMVHATRRIMHCRPTRISRHGIR